MKTSWLNKIGHATSKNSPAILSGIAVGGVIATAILASRATLKARERLFQPEASCAPSNKEIVKATWSLYVPAGLSGAATIACIIGANTIGARRNAALVAAYTLVDSAFRDYKDKVLEEIGEAKEQKIRDKVMADRIEKEPPKDGQIIMLPGGNHLIFESISGRYFRGDIEKVRQAENEFNREMLLSGIGYESLNAWFDLLGLEPTVMGDQLGWNIQRALELKFTSHLNACSGEPCLGVGYKTLPSAEYSKIY